MSTEVREYKGGAAATTLSAGIGSGAASFTVAASGGVNYPTGGANGHFYIIIDRDLASEEKIKCSARSSDTFTVSQRGADDTSASAHASGAPVEHILVADDVQQLNDHATDTTTDVHPQYLLATKVPTATGAEVLTSESTTLNTPTDLATVGPTVTVTVPASGKIKVTMSAQCLPVGPSGGYAIVSFALTGANTLAAGTNSRNLSFSGSTATPPQNQASASYLLTGLSPGSTTVTLKYQHAFATSASFGFRSLIVETYP